MSHHDERASYLDILQARLVDASRELSRARRRRARRRGAICAALIVLVTPPALAATGVWRPTLGDGRGFAPEISADSPPQAQLALLGVLRREQNEADRGVATRYALRFVDSPSLKGVRTDSIRLLAQSPQDRGVVLVPVERYEPQNPPLPADTPAEVRRTIERPPIDDALCIYHLDSVDGAGVACYSSADIQAGRAWGSLGRRSLWIVPDGVASVRTEYADHTPIVAPARENAAIFTRPQGRVTERRTVFLDASDNPVLVIDRHLPTGNPALPPMPPPAGATISGAVLGMGTAGESAHTTYQVRIRIPRGGALTLVLERPACAHERRVKSVYRGLQPGRELLVNISPTFGDLANTRWCPGTYRGIARANATRKTLGNFSFRVRG